ncbi:MAG: hypothetical protein D6731_25830 [Planctomycetota bacterium]|nr:MAG: hypothetical protein D6731_25830 [Planctomycetota bacterium]
MVRRWALALGLGLAALGLGGLAAAKECTYCKQELDDDANELECPHCDEIARKITKGNPQAYLIWFSRGELGRVQLKDDTGDVEVYWYLTYKLTNRDAVPHRYFLDITARSDRGKRWYRYHDEWIPEAYEEVRRILGKREGEQLLSQRDVSMPPPGERNELPRVDDQRTRETAHIALQTLQPGETAECVALFHGFDPEMDRLIIRIAGLSPTTLSLDHADYVTPDGKPHDRIAKEAVLELHYRRPGDEFAHSTDPVVFEGQRWVDRARTFKSDLKWRPRGLGGD